MKDLVTLAAKLTLITLSCSVAARFVGWPWGAPLGVFVLSLILAVAKRFGVSGDL